MIANDWSINFSVLSWGTVRDYQRMALVISCPNGWSFPFFNGHQFILMCHLILEEWANFWANFCRKLQLSCLFYLKACDHLLVNLRYVSKLGDPQTTQLSYFLAGNRWDFGGSTHPPSMLTPANSQDSNIWSFCFSSFLWTIVLSLQKVWKWGTVWKIIIRFVHQLKASPQMPRSGTTCCMAWTRAKNQLVSGCPCELIIPLIETTGFDHLHSPSLTWFT